MNAAIIIIGDEILIGQVTDTNSTFISKQLGNIGISVKRILTVSDNKKDIQQTISHCLSEYDIVISTGGLGPTIDDLTKSCLCDLFSCRLVCNDEVLQDIQRYLALRKGTMNDLNLHQADVPEKAHILRNPHGTAPGLLFREKEKTYIALPGVPFEMEYLITKEVLSYLKTAYKLPYILHKTIITHGTYEALLAEKLIPFEKTLNEKVKLAYLPSPGIIRLRLSIYTQEKKEAEIMLQHYLPRLELLISEHIIGYDDESLPEIIAQIFVSRNISLSLAESCTGGYLSSLLTAIPGCSRYFKGSVVAYANDIKEKIVSVQTSLLKEHGAVSKEVAEAMAIGVRKVFSSDYSIAITGIAGPEGGSTEKPVGTVWIAVCGPNGTTTSKYHWGNYRDKNIKQSAITALAMLKKIIEEKT